MAEAVSSGKQTKVKHKVTVPRRLPIGAELVPGQGVHFRVWAPKSRHVSVQFASPDSFKAGKFQQIELEPDGRGFFAGLAADCECSWHYKFKLDTGVFPDPASRFQPEGPHGPSQIIDPGQFHWTDPKWRGVQRAGQVIYELHLGTFTEEGTLAAAAEQLPELARLGITLIEVMPVADFPGRFGWGYDGVGLYAPTRLYGLPDDFRSFVDRAHQTGLGVILDVVYNHLGPDGNYLKQFSDDYFTDRYANEWGEAINFDGKNSGPVREFFVTNAAYWVEEFHLDGLRLDATQQIFDVSPQHILSELTQAARRAARGRGIYVVAENESQHAQLVRPHNQGGYGLDAIWNDDFHHSARVALAGRPEAYFSDYKGSPQEFISAAKRGFLYQGQWYAWQRKQRGTPTDGVSPEQFVNSLQNHDQVANSLHGWRVDQFARPGDYRALTALLLLGPGTPMLFQGQEFGASAPFLFFADHKPDLARLVAGGRRQFLSQFPSAAATGSEAFMAPPHSEETFQQCKLSWRERELHAGTYQMHYDLLRLRREDPVFANPRSAGIDGAVLGTTSFVLRFFGENEDDRLLLINLGVDRQLTPVPEPLLAPPAGRQWALKWSSENPIYGGSGMPLLKTDANWILPGHAAILLSPA
jgi:maltooligosyltrehalose trehalohydrolase